MTILIRENGQEWRLNDYYDGSLFEEEITLAANCTGQPTREVINALNRGEVLTSVKGRTWQKED